jgi:HEAT repeat protein
MIVYIVGLIIVMGTGFSFSGESQSASAGSTRAHANELIQQLGQFPASLPATGRSDGRPDPTEVRRRQAYDDLRELGNALTPSIVRGLADPNVQVRRSVALFLNATASFWNDYNSSKPRLDLRPYLPALTTALGDADSRVRELSAQAVGIIGPAASSAVPALIALLAEPDEGSRNTACIGLAGIGPRARPALSALRQALSDPSADVRRFAASAISKIDER